MKSFEKHEWNHIDQKQPDNKHLIVIVWDGFIERKAVWNRGKFLDCQTYNEIGEAELWKNIKNEVPESD